MRNFFKRYAFGGPFYQKGVIPCLKKVKRVTFKAHRRLNLGSGLWSEQIPIAGALPGGHQQPRNRACELVPKSQVKIGQKLKLKVKIGTLKNFGSNFFIN